MFHAKTAVALPVGFRHQLVGIQNHVRGIATERVGHDLKAALVQFEHEFLVIGGFVRERREHAAAAIGEELHEIRRDPVIVIFRTGLVEFGEELGREVMFDSDGPE